MHYTVSNQRKEREPIKDVVKENGGALGAEPLLTIRSTARKRIRTATNVDARPIQSY
jgi:hypothetical protein